MHGLAKIYGLYNMEYFEQCEFIGTKKEIASYLGVSWASIVAYLNRRKYGKQKFILGKFEIVELERK